MTIDDLKKFIYESLHSPNFDKESFDNLKKFMVDNRSEINVNDGSLLPSYKAIILASLGSVEVKKMKTIDNAEISFDTVRDFYTTVTNVILPDSDISQNAINFLSDLGIIDLIESVFDSQWLFNQYRENPDLSIHFKDLVLLYKAVLDILFNNYVACELIKAIHLSVNTTDKFRDGVDVISDRFSKYIPDADDRAPLIIGLTKTLGGSPSDNLSDKFYDEEVDSFLEYCDNIENTLTDDVFRCLVADCRQLLTDNPYLHGNTDRCDYVSKQILSKWKKGTETPFEPITNGYTQNPLEALEKELNRDTNPATEAVAKDSVAMDAASKKIYKAYKTYKEGEEKVDSQITKAVMGLKNVVLGDTRSEVIEGKRFSAIGLLKKLLGTVALFSFGKIRAVAFLVVRYALKKKVTTSERRKIIMELDTEIEMITEKINDARGDGNREAKYAMMRTKKELENAKSRIQYGMEASEKDLSNAKSTLNSARGGEV